MPQKDLKNGKILNLSSLASKETSATDPRSVKPEFFGVFFNRLGCSFNGDDHVHFLSLSAVQNMSHFIYFNSQELISKNLGPKVFFAVRFNDPGHRQTMINLKIDKNVEVQKGLSSDLNNFLTFGYNIEITN